VELLERLIGLLICSSIVAGASGCGWHGRRSIPSSNAGTTHGTPIVSTPGPFQYVNVTGEAGITFRHDDCRKGTATMMEQAGPGCALLDYDKDGWPDLYLVNGRDLYGRGIKRSNALYHNNRDGTFTDVTAKAGVPGTGYGNGVAIGDYDNDGYPDIYVCQYGKNVLYHNRGDGTFVDVTARAHVDGMDFGEPFHTGAAWVDYDRDGKLDLFVSGYVRFAQGPRYCKLDGISQETNCPPSRYEGSFCILYHNNGDGTFTNVTRRAGAFLPGSKALTPLPADFGDTGWPDIYVGNDGTPACLLHNERNGTFKEIASSAGVSVPIYGRAMAAMGIDSGDYKNSGVLSILVTDFQGKPHHLYDNMGALDGKPVFHDVSDECGLGPPGFDFLSFGGGFLDYDNDGWQDVVVVNGHVYPEVEQAGSRVHYRQHPQLFHNQQDGTFREVTSSAGPAFAEPQVSRGAVWGDLWNRGVLDILVANNTDLPCLFRNTGAPNRHFFSLVLTGTQSNRDAIGARVWVTSKGIRQMQEVKTSVSYLSSCMTRLHFGLNDATRIDKLEVRWPRGRRDVFLNVPADQFAALTEGQRKLTVQTIKSMPHRRTQ
jgi:hypothetical protein